MLSNAYFLAKFRFDTAENEPAKNLQNFIKFCIFAGGNPFVQHLGYPAGAPPLGTGSVAGLRRFCVAPAPRGAVAAYSAARRLQVGARRAIPKLEIVRWAL